jgi:hypothetical protein
MNEQEKKRLRDVIAMFLDWLIQNPEIFNPNKPSIIISDEFLEYYLNTIGFDAYLSALKKRRDKDKYNYSDKDFENHKDYIRDCWLRNLSVYKCLEFMYFESENKNQQL